MRACRSRLLQFGFWRVMLDEAQLVAASSSVAARMTSALWRRHAWVVTGTPVTARVDEIQVPAVDLLHSHAVIAVRNPFAAVWVAMCVSVVTVCLSWEWSTPSFCFCPPSASLFVALLCGWRASD